jgi:hypothetical protein
MPTGVPLLDLDASHLLGDRSELNHLLTSSVKLLGQPSMHLCLLSKAVLGILLLVEKLGLFLASRHEGLRKRHKSETRKGEATN